MRRFLICAGAHGKAGALEWLRHAVEECEPDGILFAGGVLGRCRCYEPHAATCWGLTRADALFVEHFFAALGGMGCRAFVIPGPTDTPLDEFLRLGMHAEIDHPGLHLAHATLIQTKDVAVCGMGGCLVDEAVPEPDHFPRTMVEYYLRPLWEARQPRKILMLPEVPADGLAGPLVGPVTHDLINSYHPTLCVVGGCSARRGAERVAGTLVVNPGCLCEGSAAWLDWGDKGDHVEFLDVRHAVDLATVELGVGD